jgi:hypothetical protein
MISFHARFFFTLRRLAATEESMGKRNYRLTIFQRDKIEGLILTD